MKTIFLDIDGVLKPALDSSDGPHGLNTNCLDRFNQLAEELNAQVVISSDWRHSLTLPEFNELLNNRVIGKTGYIPHAGGGRLGNRFMEIHEYCLKNNITDYIVIDDTPNELFGMTRSAWTFYFINGWIDEPLTEKVCEQIRHCKNEPFPMQAWGDLSNVIRSNSVGIGWYDLVREFVFQSKPIHAFLKKRYSFFGRDGGLKTAHVRLDGVDPAVAEYLESLKEKSKNICELCGDPGSVYILPLLQKWVRCESHRYVAVREYGAVEQFARLIADEMPAVFCISQLYFDGFKLVEDDLVEKSVIKRLAKGIYTRSSDRPIFVHELIEAMKLQYGVTCYPRGHFALNEIGYEYEAGVAPYHWYADFLLPEAQLVIEHGKQRFEFIRTEVPFDFQDYESNQLYLALKDVRVLEDVKLSRVMYKHGEDMLDKVIEYIERKRKNV